MASANQPLRSSESRMSTVSSPFYNEDHEAYRQVVRQFTEKEISPNVHEWDLAGEVPRELYNTAGAIGLFGDGFDEEYGGHGQRDALMRLVLMEELCRAGSGGVVAAIFSNYIGLPPIQRFGSDEMKARVITPCQSGDAIAALAITEPSGGSDVARIKTTARRDGDDFLVNGSKTFITSGMRADFLTTAVRTGPEGAGGISLLLIEGDRPGVDRTKLDKMGWLASDTATLYFDDVRVPASNLITEENAGFAAIMNNFNAERLDLAVQSTAFARVCFDEALAWARERETFNKRLADHQVIRHKLVEMDRLVNASEAWNELLSWRLNQGDDPVAEIAEAKVAATTTFELCAREAAQILGGASYLRGDTVERLYREVRVQAIGGGSEEIMRDLASRQLGF
ncbi:MAG: acyl-CoA dehydrogenase [Actinomycetia bacterium]|nr:acyl-CoA dehydrogenase [Actinomycetes bacterium]MCP4222911.1 acyl-CoA dehydrogenase [Actinomycetes bacterium]MCP5032095.1 acyl-CoA dehydrogenase [Actinomycetes bacterium]